MWTLAIAKTNLDDFFSPKFFQIFGCRTQSFQKKWQQRVPTGAKSYNGRDRFQPIYAIEESAGHCSRKILLKRKTCPKDDGNTFQRNGWTTQTASQGGWRSEPSKHKDLRDSAVVQCGQAREFICSSPNNCKDKKEGGWAFSTSCLCELLIWRLCLSTWCNDFCIW